MRTLDAPNPVLRMFAAEIEFLIWTEPGIEYTRDELMEVIRAALDSEPWFDGSTRKSVHQHVVFNAHGPWNSENVFGPDIVAEDGRRRYCAIASIRCVPENRLHAYGNFVDDVKKRIRSNPPRGCVTDIPMQLSFRTPIS
jgi:hypothetical protein